MSLILRHIPSLQYFRLRSKGLGYLLLWYRRVKVDPLPCVSFVGTRWPWGNSAHFWDWTCLLFMWVKHCSIRCLTAFCLPRKLWYRDTVDRSVWSPPLGIMTSGRCSVPQLSKGGDNENRERARGYMHFKA